MSGGLFSRRKKYMTMSGASSDKMRLEGKHRDKNREFVQRGAQRKGKRRLRNVNVIGRRLVRRK